MTRWKLTIAYRGESFCGWQRQASGVPSVQEAVETAIEKFSQQACRLHAAGRTDAGVHAAGQVAHFDLDYGDRPLRGYDLAKALNAHLRPLPVAVLEALPVCESFHARYGAREKLYTYRIFARSAPPVFESNLVWHIHRPLDSAAMAQAASVLVGHHDFTTFRATECQAKSPVRTLDFLGVESHVPDLAGGGQEIRVHARARSFLHHQVRNMVGALVLVGQGKWSRSDLESALAAKDRREGGPTAPPQGLCLMSVSYEDPPVSPSESGANDP